MRVLVTGARGKVGAAAARELMRAGHEVVATDLSPPEYERPDPDAPHYLQADLTDAGAAYSLVDGMDAVVHAAAIPNPVSHAPHVVFGNNVMAGFNVVEACVRSRVSRIVNISSETVAGYVFAHRRMYPPYLPLDEETPARPQDPYGFGKQVIEDWCDAAVRRADLAAVSLRPSWVQTLQNYERSLRPLIRDPSQPSWSFWAYTDNEDLAAAIRLAVEADTDGHEVLLVAQPDNCTGRPLADLVAAAFPGAGIEVRDTVRPDASGIDSRRAGDVIGWRPTRSWRDVLDASGRPLAQ